MKRDFLHREKCIFSCNRLHLFFWYNRSHFIFKLCGMLMATVTSFCQFLLTRKKNRLIKINDKQRLEYNRLYLFENLIKQYFCIPPSELLFFLQTLWTYEVLTWCFSFYGNTKIVVWCSHTLCMTSRVQY